MHAVNSLLFVLQPASARLSKSPLGREGAGVVISAPSDSSFSAGDRVACLTPSNASYAQYVALPSSSCVRVPSSVPADASCAALLQGLTAVVLTRHVYPVAAGDVVLVHAAAGGTGALIVQACRAAGATGEHHSTLLLFNTQSRLPAFSDRHIFFPREAGCCSRCRRPPFHFLR
jgi:NADPH:quinone reductase-like Zn-dependent oxidoreductase